MLITPAPQSVASPDAGRSYAHHTLTYYSEMRFGRSPRIEQLNDEQGTGKSPELNPVENVWQYMRENWLSNRVFTSYDDILDHCGEAWNKLVERPWTIMSIGLRKWAYRF